MRSEESDDAGYRSRAHGGNSTHRRASGRATAHKTCHVSSCKLSDGIVALSCCSTSVKKEWQLHNSSPRHDSA